MKKLLIFGDSFGEERNSSLKKIVKIYNLSLDILDRHNNFFTYHSYIKESNLYSEIENYSIDACGLWYQFNIFQQKYTGKEDVLFFITEPGRLYIKKIGHIPSLSNAINKILDLKKYDPNKHNESKDILKSLVHYFMYVQNSDQEIYLHHLLVKNILSICPRVNIIPCFDNSIPNDNTEIHSLWKISQLESNAWGFASYLDLHTKYWDLRCNHMIEENHEIFGKKLVDLLKHQIPINLQTNDFIAPGNSDMKKYLIKK